MISKSFEKYANSLKQKKYRALHRRFIVEGEKSVAEFLTASFPAEIILALPEWTEKNPQWKKLYAVEEINPVQLRRLSSLVAPAPVIMIAKIPDRSIADTEIERSFSIALDGINDPGNLGTIIRIADWFGIANIFCSPDCAEVFSPKTVQASMGSLARANVFETNLTDVFTRFKRVPVFAASLKGKSVFEMKSQTPAFLLIGNESHGISAALQNFVTEHVTIPRIGQAESLNAAVATGIICAMLTRR
jgi:TrmH family RNA methyltransferase